MSETINLRVKKLFPYKLYQLIGINDPSIHEGCAENLFLINIAQMTGQRGFGISKGETHRLG